MIPFVLFSMRRAWQGFWRNALMSLAATLTMVLMLVLLAGFFILQNVLLASLSFVEQKVEVVAYVQQNAPTTRSRRSSPPRGDARGRVGGVRLPGRGARAVQGDPGGAGPRRTSPSTSSRTRCYASINVKLTRPDGARRRCRAPSRDPIVRNVLNITALVNRVLTVTDFVRTAGRRDGRRRRADRAVHHRQHDPARRGRAGRGDRDHAARRRVRRVHPLAVRVRGRPRGAARAR